MTPEEREALKAEKRAKFEAMSPEEQEQIKAKRQARREAKKA